MHTRSSLFSTKPVNADTFADTGLRRCLTAFDLTLLGIGAVIGAGIFVLTGIAAATQAGPAIVLSFVLAGTACAFAALSYAELAAAIGGCGSAYGYAYAGLGEFVAWIIGWDLILEYGVALPAVAIGWSGYVVNSLQAIGVELPQQLMRAPSEGGVVNVAAMLIVLLLAGLLAAGVHYSARFNAAMVVVKLGRSARRLSPLIPLLGVACCVYLMLRLPAVTWWRFLIWLGIGVVIYFTYSRKHSLLGATA